MNYKNIELEFSNTNLNLFVKSNEYFSIDIIFKEYFKTIVNIPLDLYS